MATKHMQYHREQSGFVAILTVIFFTLLMSVISVGFLRLMVQEQDQALQDDLSKSAYQSAQAGVEDAKRAILFCAGKPTGTPQWDEDKRSCEEQLYEKVCPGFNKQPIPGVPNYFKNSLGIQDAVAGVGTSVGSAEARQGYSCVIVTRNTTSLKGELSYNGTGDATMMELRTTEPYNKIRIKWHEFASDHTPEIPLAGEFTNGNPRYPEWRSTAPALLRAKTISLPYPGSFSIADASVGNLFLYPSLFGTDAASTTVPTAAPLRIETRCISAPTSPPSATSDYGSYACAMDITFGGAAQPANRYLLLQAIYASTHYEVTAYNGVEQVDFDGVQPTIDATGYTNDVYRRVKVGVRLGSESLATNAALDTGLGFCKSFLVGGSIDVFSNDECDD